MRRLFVLLLLLALPIGPSASAQVMNAAFDRAEPPFERNEARCGSTHDAGYIGYVGSLQVCADVLVDQLYRDKRLLGGAVDEVILLTSRPQAKTLYRVGPDRQAILPLSNLIRQSGNPLTVRGQRGPGGEHLVWLKGLDLIDTVCDPSRVLDPANCRAGAVSKVGDVPAASWDGRYEMTSLALIEEAEVARALRRSLDELGPVTKHGPRSYCIRLRQVRGVVLSDLAFEDCWIAAVSAVNSRDITLERARIHGSTFGMLAIATSGKERAAHTFRIVGNHWIQSPAAYRPDPRPCERPHLDLGCAVDVWDDLPWGVTHHHIWRPLNGALFGAYNIAGNVLFENNLLERIYNGIRMISRFPWTGRNVEIRGNRFRFVRDNAVEPEDHADNWVIKHNVFENVHAWISSDGVKGGSMYVYGNRGWYDPNNMPGQHCRKAIDWSRSPFFAGMAGNAGRYLLIDTSYDPTSVECLGHIRGAILKTGDKRKAKFPYFNWISIFNNSWRTRSPLFSSKHASRLSHFNNAVAFTGCGLDGPLHCRQIPAPTSPDYSRHGVKEVVSVD